MRATTMIIRVSSFMHTMFPALKSFTRSSVIVLNVLLGGHATGQEVTHAPRHGVQFLVCSAMQRPLELSLGDQRSIQTAQHLFIALVYERSIDELWRIGIGGGRSWGRYTLDVDGLLTGPSGTSSVSGENSTSPIIDQIRGQFHPRSLKTDPEQFWLQATHTIADRGRSELDVQALVGGMNDSPWGITLGVDLGSSSTEQVRAETSWGNGWHALYGMCVNYSYRTTDAGRISIGVDWRMSSQNYFDLSLVTLNANVRTGEQERQARFMWFGVKMGYTFSCGAAIKRGRRQMEELDQE